MTELVNQPTAAPSRKVFNGAVTAIVTAGLQHTVVALAGDVPALSWLGQDAVLTALPIIAGYAVSYYMAERKV